MVLNLNTKYIYLDCTSMFVYLREVPRTIFNYIRAIPRIIIVCVTRFLDSRVGTVFLYFLGALFLLDSCLTFLETWNIIDLSKMLDDLAPSECLPKADFSATNPYRDLPENPAILNAIKECEYSASVRAKSDFKTIDTRFDSTFYP